MKVIEVMGLEQARKWGEKYFRFYVDQSLLTGIA